MLKFQTIYFLHNSLTLKGYKNGKKNPGTMPGTSQKQFLFNYGLLFMLLFYR